MQTGERSPKAIWKEFPSEGENMRIDYDPVRDLLYLYFADPETKAAQTQVIVPGVHADFDREGKLLGIEILEASKRIGKKIEFGLPEVAAALHI